MNPPQMVMLGVLATWPSGVPTDTVFAEARRAVAALGVYHATIVKTERVRGKLLGPEVADVWIRERPRAVRMTFMVKDVPGRRVLYNETVRAGQMLVRERGLFGMMSIWVAIDSWLVRRNTSHTVRDVGFGPLLDLIDRDVARARPAGGHRRTDEPPGQGPAGTTCVVFTAPPDAPGLYAARTRLCFDRGLGLPVFVEVFDRTGLLERYEWRNVRPRQTVGDSFFLAQGAGF
jgi:hypothetical protein